MAQTLYRIVQGRPAIRWDFMSNQARGQRPMGPERADPDLYGGLSLWDTPTACWGIIGRFPHTGTAVAEVVIPDGAPVRIAKTRGPGHYTVWGDPDLLLGCVARIL